MDSILLRLQGSLKQTSCIAVVSGAILAGLLAPAHAAAFEVDRGATLVANSELKEREAMVSPEGDFTLMTQSDGNLCVSHRVSGAAIWCSRDTVAPGRDFRTFIQSDGNICTVGSEGTVWCLRDEPADGNAFFLALQDDANLCMYQGAPGRITGTVWCSMALATPAPKGAPLTYGSAYHVKNLYGGRTNTYLDTRSSRCESNWLCVSMAASRDRDQGSGSWIVLSAQGKPNGALVKEGDLVLLANKYPYEAAGTLVSGRFGGFLDTRGAGCEGNALCVSTAATATRDGRSGVWKIEGGYDTIHTGQHLRLRNQYNGSYLDTRGSGCESNVLCVSASVSPNRDNGSGSWSFEVANNVSDEAALATLRYYVETFSPRVRLHPDDPYLPDSADFYLSNSAMHAAVIRDEGSEADISTPSISYTASEVAALGMGVAAERLRQRLTPAGAIKLWLSPDDQTKAGSLARAKTYVTVSKQDNVYKITYWYFFAYNGAGRVEGCAASSSCITIQASQYGSHQGDWEHAQVEVTESGHVQSVKLSRHGDLVAANIEDWDRYHPVIYSAYYSHALYPGRGQQNYQRLFSKSWGLGTVSADLFDYTSDGGKTFQITDDNSYELLAVSGVAGVTKTPRELFKFAGRWGRYQVNRESLSIPFHTFEVKEIGAGPNTPDFR